MDWSAEGRQDIGACRFTPKIGPRIGPQLEIITQPRSETLGTGAPVTGPLDSSESPVSSSETSITHVISPAFVVSPSASARMHGSRQ